MRAPAHRAEQQVSLQKKGDKEIRVGISEIKSSYKTTLFQGNSTVLQRENHASHYKT